MSKKLLIFPKRKNVKSCRIYHTCKKSKKDVKFYRDVKNVIFSKT
jgi:hypothetical protein